MTPRRRSPSTGSVARSPTRAHCVLAPNPGPDDPRRHQHLGAARARRHRRRRHRPRSARRGPPARGASTRSPRGAPASPRRSSPTATPTTPRAAARFAELTGAPTRAVGRGHDDLGDGDVVRAGGLELRVVATPGHTSDSLSFALAADHALLTGDTVLGRGTTVVAHPDGELAAYLASLERIAAPDRRRRGDRDPARARAGRAGCRGDGRVLPQRTARERLEQVRQALARSGAPAGSQDVVERVYADVPREVWPAAAAQRGRAAGLPARAGEVSGRGA